jgi:hypothetical protein
MTVPKYDGNSVAFALLLFIAAQGGHWFITPMRHPNATSLDHWLVALQTLACASAAIWVYRRRERVAGGGAS